MLFPLVQISYNVSREIYYTLNTVAELKAQFQIIRYLRLKPRVIKMGLYESIEYNQYPRYLKYPSAKAFCTIFHMMSIIIGAVGYNSRFWT